MTFPSALTDSPAPLKVCILWHMHQPDYRDPVGGLTLLPWTWLHGLKDYGEMLETVAQTKAKVTVNLVPSLLEQLERYAIGKDQDRWLELIARPAEKLTDAERQFAVEQFFSVNVETQILPNRRYHQLYLQRGTLEPRAESFSHQDILDLQVCFLLAWTGYHLRQRSPLVSALLERGGLYHEEQKQQLLLVCHEEIARILDFHRELEAAGLIEITVTPYAHPILPLLCNLQSAWEPSPGLPLPAADFRHPEDARLQVREGLRTAERFFGKRRRGMWPAEGGVSHDAMVLMQEEGALWAATDEDILARSLDSGLRDRSRLYQFYEYEGLPLIFRDRELSDRVGFLYATWKPSEAVADIQQRLRQIARIAPGGTVAIILDGENCWERYIDNGYPFLRDFYEMLHKDDQFVMNTISEALEQSVPEPLTRLAAGSWIRADFTTWIGHPEDNVAWQMLYQARHDCITSEVKDALANPQEPLSNLVQELLRAEGSDWFWWFGDEHSSLQADIFDRLFRLHLEGMYHLRGLSVPAALQQRIKPGARTIAAGYEPSACFTPTIDGRIGDYFEWLATGCIDLSVGGAMYSGREGLQNLYYGYDNDHLYFRIDQPDLLRRLCGKEGYFELRLNGRGMFNVCFSFTDNKVKVLIDGKQVPGGRGACDKVLELAVPVELLQLEQGKSVRVSCRAVRQQREIGRWPTEGDVVLCYRGNALDEENWSV